MRVAGMLVIAVVVAAVLAPTAIGSVISEGETTCPPEADTLNGGCLNGVPLVTPIFSGQLICATTGARLGTRDTDWYEWTNGSETMDIAVRVISETRQVVWLLATPQGDTCTGEFGGIAKVNSVPGEPIDLILYGVPPGQRRFVYTTPATSVNDGVFDGVECGTRYSLEFVARAPTPGACCFTAGDPHSCLDNTTPAQCRALSGVYRAAIDDDGNPTTPPIPSTCAGLACRPDPCDPAASAEGGTSEAPQIEPPCLTGGADIVNGGCDVQSGVRRFRDLRPADRICGTSWFDLTSGSRDSDWFTLSLSAAAGLTATVDAQFDAEIWIYRAGAPAPGDSAGCASRTLVARSTAPARGLAIAGARVEAGTYYIRVAPSEHQDIPCTSNARYTLTVSSCDGPPTFIGCSGGSIAETAADASCVAGNDGCSIPLPTASDFQPLSGGRVCATSRLVTDPRSGVVRDPDWYVYNHPGGQASFSLRSEFAADMYLLTPRGGRQGCDEMTLEDALVLSCATIGSESTTLTTSANFPAGPLFILIVPSFFQDDFACGKRYELALPGAPPCPCLRDRGDVNGDCRVDGSDLSVLLAQYGQNVPPGTGSDINGSGSVNGADLSVILSNFNCH